MKNGKKQKLNQKNMRRLEEAKTNRSVEESLDRKIQAIEYGKDYYENVEENQLDAKED